MSSSAPKNPEDREDPPADSAERRSLAPGRLSVPPDGVERRTHPRIDVTWAVDCSDGENFLYSYITNISALGIFVSTRAPLPRGTPVTLRFVARETPDEHPFELAGEVAWINPLRPEGENLNPGFGVRFTDLDADTRERLVSLVHAIAYLPDDTGA